MDSLRLVIGSDDFGQRYRGLLRSTLRNDSRVCSVLDIGVNPRSQLSHPHIAASAAKAIVRGFADRALLISSTGLGLAIAANKVDGIRAVTAHDSYSVEQAVRVHDAQILVLGQTIIGIDLARRLVDEWLGYRFEPRLEHALTDTEGVR